MRSGALPFARVQSPHFGANTNNSNIHRHTTSITMKYLSMILAAGLLNASALANPVRLATSSKSAVCMFSPGYSPSYN